MERNMMRSSSARKNKQSNERFRFTPIATSKRMPRLWDRKPTTPNVPRSKAHKVWKRFISSTSSTAQDFMGGRDSLDGVVIQESHAPFQTEINVSDTLAVIRGVKRLRLGRDAGDNTEGGRSFLETKWEKMTERKRKYATVSNRELDFSVVDGEQDDVELGSGIQEEDEESCSDIASPTPLRRKDMNHETPTISSDDLGELPAQEASQELDKVEDVDEPEQSPENTADSVEVPSIDPSVEAENTTSEIDENEPHTDPPRDEAPSEPEPDRNEPSKETQPPQKTSRFRLPSLDGDDAELFSNLISQAKAKRVGNSGVASSLANADKAMASPVPLSPTKPRRALEYLDKNSPRSPERQMSPARTTKNNSSKNNNNNLKSSLTKRPILSLTPPKNSESEQEPEKVVRKQLRPRPSSDKGNSSTEQSKTKKQVPKVPDQIPVRRAKGTEFIFLKRSESQELALTTKANTKRNKGSARPADLVLEDLKNGVRSDNQDSTRNKKSKAQGSDTRKRVKWNKNLEEYCDSVEFEAQGYSERSARLQERREKRMRKQFENDMSDGEQDKHNKDNSKDKGKAPAKPATASSSSQPKPKSKGNNSNNNPTPKPGSTPGARKMRKLVGTRHKDVVPDDSATPPPTKLKLSIKPSSTFPGTPIRRKGSSSLAMAAAAAASAMNHRGGEPEGESLFSVPFAEEARRTRRSGRDGGTLGMGLGGGGADVRAKKPSGLPCPTPRRRGRV